MATSTFQAAKLDVVSLFELSKDALHIHIGLLVFIAAAILLRRPLRSAIPIMLVLVVACIAETFDARDDISDLGYWRVGASMHDIVNTMFGRRYSLHLLDTQRCRDSIRANVPTSSLRREQA